MISIKDAMKQTNYNEDLKNEFENYLKEFVNKNSGKIFLFSRNKKSPKIFLLQTNLTSFFKGEKYDISVLCYFPINFPGSPPEIYLEKIGNVKVNPRCNFYISEENLKINFILFIEWKCNFYCLNRVLDEIKNQFSFAFPIFNLPNEKNDGIVEGDCILNGKNLVEVEIKNEENFNKNNNNFNDFNNNFNDFNNNNNNNINNTHGRFNSDFIGKYNNNNNGNEFNLFNDNDNEINNNNNNITNDDFSNNNINDYNNDNSNKSMSYNYRGVPMNNTNRDSYYNNPNLTINYFNKLNINEPNFNNNNNLNNNNNNLNNNNNNLNNNNNNNLNNNNEIFEVIPQKPIINEQNCKKNLIKKLIINLMPKIKNNITISLRNTIQMEQINKNIENSMKSEFLIKNENFDNINNIVNNLNVEINKYFLSEPEKINFKENFDDLEKILIIKKKDFYVRLAKENLLEELIKLVKKSFERETIDFECALRTIRMNTRNIFFFEI